MPQRKRSLAQEIEERIAAGDVTDEEAARVAVADDIATGRLVCRYNFEEGIPGPVRRLEIGVEFDLEFRPTHKKPRHTWNLWPQIRAGKINGVPVEYSPDNKTITAGSLKIVDIVVWDRNETTAESTAKRMPPVRRGLPARGAARIPAPTPQSHTELASPKRHPGDTNKDRGELLYQAAKPHTGALSWSTDTAFAAAQNKFSDNPLLVAGMSSRNRRRAWLYAKQKLQKEA